MNVFKTFKAAISSPRNHHKILIFAFASTALLSASPLFTACGRNVVETYAPENDQEKAELDMEAGRYETAIERLNRVLEREPANYEARSLIAAAYAAEGGITTLSLVKNVTAASASGGSALQKFTAILPEATTENLNFLDQACASMALIPVESRGDEVKIQYSLFFSAYAFLQIKYFTTHADALASLSAEDAAKLILTLAKAGEAGGSSPLTTAATSLSNTISAAPGEAVDKVKAALTAAAP
jgi:tetratricopeptide (TPR) repeat protein